MLEWDIINQDLSVHKWQKANTNPLKQKKQDLQGMELGFSPNLMRSQISPQRLPVSLSCFPLYASFCVSIIHIFSGKISLFVFQEGILSWPSL